MKQFNLEEYLKNPSRKVVTRDGRNVRILCTDAKGNYPIVALIETLDGSIEFINKFKKDGHFLNNDNDNSNLDLFFVPEKHEGWINLYKNLEGFIVPSRIYQTKEDAEKRGNVHDCYVVTAKIEWEE